MFSKSAFRSKSFVSLRPRGESLEERCVLSGVPVDAESDPSLAAYLALEHDLGPVAPSEPLTDADNPSPDPAAVDEVFDDLGDQAEGEDDGTIGSGGWGGGTVNTAPSLDDLRLVFEEGVFTLAGFAHDDQSSAGDLQVTFTGLFEGSLNCESDGSFLLPIERPESSGYIYATVFDGELTSNQLEVYFSAE